jgi:hypothetical protein
MAARRERERRRPSERRYNFAPAESEVVDANGTDAEARDAVTDAEVAIARGTTARPTPPPFSAYTDEYAYVYRDLRRVAAVIGGLLVGLVVLYLLLPLLVH